MQRWIKNGGWIAILTVCIFLAYCTFYLVHNQKTSANTTINLVGIDFLTLTAYAEDDASPPTGDSPSGGSDPSNPSPSNTEPSGDSPEDIHSNEQIEVEKSPTIPAAVSDTESQNRIEDDEMTIEETESETAFDEYGGEFILEDEITLLTQIRDILNIILHLIILAISGFIVWLIILPIWKMAKG